MITSIAKPPWPLTLSRCQMAILAMGCFHSILPNAHRGWLGGQPSGLPTLEHIVLPIKKHTWVVGQPSYERHGPFQDSTGEPPLKHFNPHAAICWQLPDHMLHLYISASATTRGSDLMRETSSCIPNVCLMRCRLYGMAPTSTCFLDHRPGEGKHITSKIL